ncbi:hypothetical protein AN221_42420, partial [Streptomyces nanshensis]
MTQDPRTPYARPQEAGAPREAGRPQDARPHGVGPLDPPAVPLVLTPPEPVAPVRAEQAAGLVPVEDAVREEMVRRGGG